MILEGIKITFDPAPEVTEEQKTQIESTLDLALSLLSGSLPGKPSIEVCAITDRRDWK